MHFLTLYICVSFWHLACKRKSFQPDKLLFNQDLENCITIPKYCVIIIGQFINTNVEIELLYFTPNFNRLRIKDYLSPTWIAI